MVLLVGVTAPRNSLPRVHPTPERIDIRMLRAMTGDAANLQIRECVIAARGDRLHMMDVRADHAPRSAAQTDSAGRKAASFTAAECTFVDDEAATLPIGRISRPATKYRLDEPSPEEVGRRTKSEHFEWDRTS